MEFIECIADDVKPSELAGKDVSLHVTIKEARERRTPALDDELAKDTGEADTLADLRKKVEERLTEVDKRRIKRETETALWQRFSAARNGFDKARRVHFAQLDATQGEAKATKEALVAEAEALPFSDGSFDLVSGHAVLHHCLFCSNEGSRAAVD